MFLQLITVFLIVSQTQAYWQMSWSEEFDQNYTSFEKWEVYNETTKCNGLDQIFNHNFQFI